MEKTEKQTTLPSTKDETKTSAGGNNSTDNDTSKSGAGNSGAGKNAGNRSASKPSTR